MSHPNLTENRPDLSALFIAKIEAMLHGDLEELHEVRNKIFYATLDPADPNYEKKLANHKKVERERCAERHAKQVIQESGKPLNFWDSMSAINEAIDLAVDLFERYPCPQHAADLLGLIECRSLLFDAHMDEISPSEEDTD